MTSDEILAIAKKLCDKFSNEDPPFCNDKLRRLILGLNGHSENLSDSDLDEIRAAWIEEKERGGYEM